MVAVPCVGCMTLWKDPDATDWSEAPPFAVGNSSCTRRSMKRPSGRNAYQAANNTITIAATANFHIFNLMSPPIQEPATLAAACSQLARFRSACRGAALRYASPTFPPPEHEHDGDQTQKQT